MKPQLTITTEDAPALGAIANDGDNSLLENIILFVGTEGTDAISIDNITVSGNREMVETPVEHDPIGEPVLPIRI
ncbi:MAG: carbohydrate-binding domain-containing protein [Alkalibacterium sp.]|nr:carbohydrate-binding domain-containing protein [Alkalibacterium sp.]